MSAGAISSLDSSNNNTQRRRHHFLPPQRQIRFVSSDGQPHAKRRRINAACLTCRKRKTRCSGERPECKTCTDNGHICAGYAEPQQRKDGDDERDDHEDDDESTTSSSLQKPRPGQQEQQLQGKGSTKQVPKVEKHPFAESASSARSSAREGPDIGSPASNHTANSSMMSTKTRVPYFRYFGPTAIVPGFKQMVVQMKDPRPRLPSAAGGSPASLPQFDSASVSGCKILAPEIPFYNATDPAPNSHLVTHLCNIFFTHLGCNYPFLQRERFLRDLEDKKVDVILVDAVCAVSARFSAEPLLAKTNDQSVPLSPDGTVKQAFRGHPFSQRAMAAVVDTFSCPTIAVAQACLLLAYEEFGTDHDSGLWMYLGTSIRMAQDLGIQKLEGLQLEGRVGPTPKTAKHGHQGKIEEAKRSKQQDSLALKHVEKDESLLGDRRASEQERIDTFWAIFFLDRAVSSGVGRPVTLRDKDIEISFPHRPDETAVNGYPHPFPPLIRIVHMYGRVADVLNNIKGLSQVTPEVLKRLAGMEKDLTGIYQRLSPKLYFNATNFQHYVRANQGTNFILLHFWFHTLIVLLHQPTLLHSFEGSIQQLFLDSRELSISSAKTITDILAFAELIDVKSFIGNPFTSQPMYVAACAFLAEASAHASQPPSRGTTPPVLVNNGKSMSSKSAKCISEAKAALAKHSLLASAANQNYQRCYKALKMLDSYWAGCRYILTALDQKSKGLMDPLLYTPDDVDGEMPSTVPDFTTPGWRRSIANSVSVGGPASAFNAMRQPQHSQGDVAYSPWNQAIGISLTGTTNSPAPNLSVLYANPGAENGPQATTSNENQKQQSSVRRLKKKTYETNALWNMDDQTQLQPQVQANQQPNPYSVNAAIMPPVMNRPSSLSYDPVSTADADLLLGLHSPFSMSAPSPFSMPQVSVSHGLPIQSSFEYMPTTTSGHPLQNHVPTMHHQYFQDPHMDFADLLIESQDLDMPSQRGGFSFAGGDVLPWLEYLPQDVLNYFGEAQDPNRMDIMPGPGSSGHGDNT